MTSTDGSVLPSGTVTFLFLDIERSTELIGQVGAEYPHLLETYRTVTVETASAAGGVMFGAEGDGLFLAFPDAAAAVASAVAIQRAFMERSWPGGAEVRVRMGIHTGTPTLIGDDYTGIDVHRAARVMSAGWGGQILISDTTQSLLGAGEWSTRELGWFAMKGLSRYERLLQVEAPGLPTEFPALQARRREVELPVAMTSLVGRDREIDAVSDLLRSGARLVTLSGPGGVGKTRLAVAVAERMDDAYADGVVFADVSNESDPAGMAVVVAESVGATHETHRDPMDSVIDHLSSLRMLLVVDGFERFSASAMRVADLLAKCPGLQMLVTSRVVLRIGAEREFRVSPLSVAAPGSSIEAIRSSPAVRLFFDRARAVRPGPPPDDDELAAVGKLVAILEGNPLSIELAAARSRLMTPVAILERLETVLDLGTTSPELPERQRSLRATIEWSHGLLDPPEQQLLRRLGVFVDGWTVEAAEAVAGGESDVIIGLENLVSQSLVQVDAETRMTMGTALREFAAEQLAATGEEDTTRHKHARYYTELAERSEPLMRGPRQRELVVSLSRDWHNFRSAGEWALTNGHLDLAGRLYVNIWILSWQGDNWNDSESFTERLTPSLGQLAEPVRARAMFIAAGTYMEMGDGEKALTFARPGAELARRIEDRATEAWSRLMIAGSVSIEDISSVEAREQIDTAVALARELEDDFLLGYSLSFQGAVRTLDGEFGEALACHEESLELARGLDNKVLQTQATSQMAMTHLAAGDRAEARTALEAGLDQVDDVRSLEALALYLDAVAWLAFAESNTVRAMTALGAANSTRARVGAARWATVAGLLEAAGLAAEGSQPALADARHAGSEMSPHDAIAFAIQPPRELATAS